MCAHTPTREYGRGHFPNQAPRRRESSGLFHQTDYNKNSLGKQRLSAYCAPGSGLSTEAATGNETVNNRGLGLSLLFRETRLSR